MLAPPLGPREGKAQIIRRSWGQHFLPGFHFYQLEPVTSEARKLQEEGRLQGLGNCGNALLWLAGVGTKSKRGSENTEHREVNRSKEEVRCLGPTEESSVSGCD